jgi:hypothetical protein
MARGIADGWEKRQADDYSVRKEKTMRTWIGLISVFIAAELFAGSVPGQITYQGTLKESNVPVNAARMMQFRLTNANGTAVYWSSGNMSVNVSQGLFSVPLNPTGVDWQNVLPHMEVSVEGQLLLPREPVTSTAYALMCGSVADGSILSGMIALFARDCPAGWTRFSELDGFFPMGGASYGSSGGATSHEHTLTMTQLVGGAGGSLAVGVFPGQNGLTAFSGGGSTTIQQMNNTTNSRSHLPPYRMMVYCQKL